MGGKNEEILSCSDKSSILEDYKECDYCKTVPEQIIQLSCGDTFCLNCIVEGILKGGNKEGADISLVKCQLCEVVTELSENV